MSMKQPDMYVCPDKSPRAARARAEISVFACRYNLQYLLLRDNGYQNHFREGPAWRVSNNPQLACEGSRTREVGSKALAPGFASSTTNRIATRLVLD